MNDQFSCPQCGQLLPIKCDTCQHCGFSIFGSQSHASSSTVSHAAHFTERASAFLLDACFYLLFHFILCWGIVFWPIARQMKTFQDTGEITSTILFNTRFSYYQIALLTIVLSNMILLPSLRGQPIGKMILGIKTIRADGRSPGFFHCALRFLSYLLSAIPLGAGFFCMLWDKHHETWHDKITKTKVIPVKPGNPTNRIFPIFSPILLIVLYTGPYFYETHYFNSLDFTKSPFDTSTPEKAAGIYCNSSHDQRKSFFLYPPNYRKGVNALFSYEGLNITNNILPSSRRPRRTKSDCKTVKINYTDTNTVEITVQICYPSSPLKQKCRLYTEQFEKTGNNWFLDMKKYHYH